MGGRWLDSGERSVTGINEIGNELNKYINQEEE